MNEFWVEAEYADSMVRSTMGDVGGSITALERALALNPSYAPAILSMGSVEYQRGRTDKGHDLFWSLLSLPEGTPELSEIVDKAGTFLIQTAAYEEGLALYRE